jgi:superfamily I DNA and RNA helicase
MIEKNLNEALVKQESGARALLTILFNIDNAIPFNNASVYHQFPIYPNIDGFNTISANVLFISAEYGIFIFQCIDNTSRITPDYQDNVRRLNEIDRLLFAKIYKDAPSLQLNRRSLKVNISPALFISSCDKIPQNSHLQELDVICTEAALKEYIYTQKNYSLSDNEYADLKATVEGSKGIIKVTERKVRNADDFERSKGAILSAIESQIYNFDLEQKRSALFVLDDAQRIRGLAGSGKTIILAMKAAMIHLQFPDYDILYTYNTKSMNDLVKRLITRFYRQFAENDPNWNKIHIMHAWGGTYLEGVYSSACSFNSIPRISLSEAKAKRPSDPFDYACEVLNSYSLKNQYDFTLIDEAQDFPANFYRVCRQITKRNRVVWAYDDFQNILNTNIQDEKETFGKDPSGNYYIDFSKRTDELQDMVLYKCYRNPRKILISAFALGLGIYNKTQGHFQVIQRLESNEHWESLGFLVEQGDSKDNSLMVISRPEKNTPYLKNRLLDSDNVITIHKYDTFEKECASVAEAILLDLSLELNPEDVNVICMDNRNVGRYFDTIAAILEGKGVATFDLHKAPSNNTLFKVKNHVTLSTIFTAKGNEAGSVYIVGIDSVFGYKNDITERNKIFTAMTRSLAWVTMTGVGNSVDFCIEELNELKRSDFKLRFVQPSDRQVRTIRQGINKMQKVLNEIERAAEELSRSTGLSKDEIVEQLKRKMAPKP